MFIKNKRPKALVYLATLLIAVMSVASFAPDAIKAVYAEPLDSFAYTEKMLDADESPVSSQHERDCIEDDEGPASANIMQQGVNDSTEDIAAAISALNTTSTYISQEILTIFNDTNTVRAEVEKPPFVLDLKLCTAADIRAQEITQLFSHTRPNGTSQWTTMYDADFYARFGFGENIAYGYGYEDVVMRGWKNSPGHYTAMIGSSAAIGIGVAYDEYGIGYFVQLFSSEIFEPVNDEFGEDPAPGDSGTYNAGDIAAINNIIDNNGLKWSKAAPANGSYIPASWTGVTWSDDATNKRVTAINLSYNLGYTQGEKLTGGLNVSGLTSLKYLFCESNDLASVNVSGLTSLIGLYCHGNKLPSLDVSGLTDLETLFCHKNNINLLTLSGASVLKRLYCKENQLEVLNIAGSTALGELACNDNKLTSLNVAGRNNLLFLNCSNNKLASLDTSGLSALVVFWCYSNHLTSMDMSDCVSMKRMDCSHNYFPDMSAVAGMDNVNAFTYWGFGETTPTDGIVFYFDPQWSGPPPQLNTLTVVGGTGATGAGSYWTNDTVNISAGTPPAGLVFKNWTSDAGGTFGDADSAVTIFKMPGNAVTVTANYEPMYTLIVSAGTGATGSGSYFAGTSVRITAGTAPAGWVFKNWTSDAGGTFNNANSATATFTMPASAATVTAVYSPLYHPDDVAAINNIIDSNGLNWTKANPADGSYIPADWNWDHIAGHGIIWTYVSTNKRIESLYIGGNSLGYKMTGALDVSGLTGALYIQCSQNDLTSINMSGMTALAEIRCENNQLTALDASGLTSLKTIRCEGNKIASIGLSGCGSLTHLYGNNNEIESLDVSDCVSIKWLEINNNKLSALDASGRTTLEWIECNNNNITSLTVSGCSSLYWIECYNNQLTALDVSGCANLTELYCFNNKLTSLNVSNCTTLYWLNCSYNYLASINAIIGLKDLPSNGFLIFDPQNEIQKATISFDTMGGASVGNIKRAEGEVYGTLPLPRKNGNVFVGWFTTPGSDGTEIKADTIIGSVTDHTLYARWQLSVTWNGGMGAAISGGASSLTVSYVYMIDQWGAAPTAIRLGYTFGGWYTSTAYKTAVTHAPTDTVALAGNTTYYAKWTANPYNVVFDPDKAGAFFTLPHGTNVSKTSKIVTFGSKYGALPVPKLDGWTFDGWYTEPGGAGTKVTSATKLTTTGDKALYAKWKTKNYKVTFHANGGKIGKAGSVGVQMRSDDTVYRLPDEPERAGYTFSGWHFDKAATAGPADETTFVTALKNHTLYAGWSGLSYPVTFDVNGGDAGTALPGSYVSQFNTVWGSAPNAALPVALPAAGSGKVFKGWSLGNKAGSVIVDGTVWKAKPGVVTLYAQYTDSVTITYDANGGTVKPAGKELKLNALIYGKLAAPKWTGYTFTGWYDSADTGYVNMITAESSLTFDPYETAQSIYAQKLVAKWEPNKYTVTFNKNAGDAVFTGPAGVSDVTHNTSVGASAWPGDPARGGYKFTGWFTKKSGGERVTEATPILKTMTVFAQWTKPAKTVNFNVNGGAFAVVSDKSMAVVWGEAYGTLPAPAPPAHYPPLQFDGWYTTKADTVKVKGEKVTDTTLVSFTANAQTLFARWTTE